MVFIANKVEVALQKTPKPHSPLLLHRSQTENVEQSDQQTKMGSLPSVSPPTRHDLVLLGEVHLPYEKPLENRRFFGRLVQSFLYAAFRKSLRCLECFVEFLQLVLLRRYCQELHRLQWLELHPGL